MRKILLALIVFSVTGIYATVPPVKGVTPPLNFEKLKQEIGKSYNKGYYAQKFSARKLLQEKIAKGLVTPSGVSTDSVFALTLLGNYSDATPRYSPEAFQTKLFNGPNPTGTVTEFYNEISYGQMHFTGQCKGWYQVPGTLESYVGTDNGLGVNGGPKFVVDLINACDADLNFADYIQYYDNNGNPHIGFIAVVHTGSDAAAGGHNIWSHRWTFTVKTGKAYTTNDTDPVSGKKVIIDGDYAIEPEFGGSSNEGGNLIDIGVFAHEFGHIFGLPDLYDTDYTSEGLGNWCLMAGGAYGGDGQTSRTPVHMSAWCKKELGWVTPIDISGYSKDLSVPNAEQNPVCYKMWKNNDPNSKEYFLVENRQQTGFDKNLYSPGFLVYHVDDSRNTNSNENHYLVGLMQADNKKDLNSGSNRGDAGDPFPGSSQNVRFDLTTAPNSNTYSGDKTFVSLRNIRADGKNMIADFDIGTKPFVDLKEVKILELIPQNGRVEPGEEGNISFKLSNEEFTPSLNAKFTFEFNDPLIEILTPQVTLSVDGQTIKSDIVSAAFRVKPEFQSKMVTLKYNLETEGNSISDSIYLVVGIPKVLIISKAEKSSLTNYYTSSLSKLGYNVEEDFNKTPEFLSRRDFLVYLTGMSSDSLFSNEEIDSLSSYMEHGGRIFFSGQNIAEYLKVNYPSFLNDQIGIDWVKNGTIFYRKAFGISGDLFGGEVPQLSFYGLEGAKNERGPDIISSNGNFNMSFSYKENGVEGAGGWTTKSSGSKIVFLGFGFESINNLETSKSRDEIMSSVVDWFNNVTSISDLSVPVNSFNLFQNYPNPFNPTTKIRFTIPSNNNLHQNATVKIYDILGNEVVVLLNKELSAGEHEVNFEGKDKNGNSLSSGVYYYSLNAGDFSQTKKMLLLK